MSSNFLRSGLVLLVLCFLLIIPNFNIIAQDNTEFVPTTVQDDSGNEMVVVPPGCFQMGIDERETDTAPVTEVCFKEPFLFDRYEVTNAQVNNSSLITTASQFTDDEQPRDSVTWRDASAYCASRTYQNLPMSLPTEAEWEYAARGPENKLYPFGNEPEPGVAAILNNDVNSQPTQVAGLYQGGASWVGALDMAGNVWEWTGSRYRPYPYDENDGRETPPVDENDNEARVLRGGSANNTIADVYAANRFARSPGNAYGMIGFRCAVDITLEQLRGIVPVPEPELEKRTFGNAEMVRIPAGCFQIGSDDDRAEPKEQPVSEVCIENDYFIDIYEVTNEQVQTIDFTFSQEAESNNPQAPRDNVTWHEARAYCEARGARLPTEAEWEYAARGGNSSLYVWGSQFGSAQADYFIWRSNSGAIVNPVGSRPETDVSWAGVIDLAGNISEWTSTILAPYPYDSTDGREDPDDEGSRRVIRGVHYNSSDFPRMSLREGLKPGEDVYRNVTGFRCARDVIGEVGPDPESGPICEDPEQIVDVRFTINELRVIDTLEDSGADDILVQYFFNLQGSGSDNSDELSGRVLPNDVLQNFMQLDLNNILCSDTVSIIILALENDEDGSKSSLISYRTPLSLQNDIPENGIYTHTEPVEGSNPPYFYELRYTVTITRN